VDRRPPQAAHLAHPLTGSCGRPFRRQATSPARALPARAAGPVDGTHLHSLTCSTANAVVARVAASRPQGWQGHSRGGLTLSPSGERTAGVRWDLGMPRRLQQVRRTDAEPRIGRWHARSAGHGHRPRRASTREKGTHRQLHENPTARPRSSSLPAPADQPQASRDHLRPACSTTSEGAARPCLPPPVGRPATLAAPQRGHTHLRKPALGPLAITAFRSRHQDHFRCTSGHQPPTHGRPRTGKLRVGSSGGPCKPRPPPGEAGHQQLEGAQRFASDNHRRLGQAVRAHRAHGLLPLIPRRRSPPQLGPAWGP